MSSTPGDGSSHPEWHTNLSVSVLIQKIKEAIWRRRPILGEIMSHHGDDILFNYAEDFLDVNPAPRLDTRKSELIAVVEELLATRLGSTVAREVAEQLSELALVSTADHHGPVTHPLWVNSNIISALPSLETASPLKYLVVFSFGSVSVNNHTYPRGILFHAEDNGRGSIVHLPLLPDREKMGVVYGMRPFTKADLEHSCEQLAKKVQQGEVGASRGQKICALVKEYFGSQGVLNAPDLATQITKINYSLWPRLFHSNQITTSSTAAAAKIPDLIYLDIETLTTELLARHHLGNQKSLIYKLLFDPHYQAMVNTTFDGIPGAFSQSEGWGTHLFWALDDKHHRVRMFLDENELHSTYRRHVATMTPEGIKAALERKEIFPSMLLCYLMVSLYYGMKCLGGFCQVNDLTLTKQAWGKLLRAVGETDEAEAIEPVQTKELGGDGMILAYLPGGPAGQLIPATGIDMILEEPDTTLEGYIDLSKKTTLSEMMNPMLPEIYTVLYSQVERDPELTLLTVEKIMQETNHHHKMFRPTAPVRLPEKLPA